MRSRVVIWGAWMWLLRYYLANDDTKALMKSMSPRVSYLSSSVHRHFSRLKGVWSFDQLLQAPSFESSQLRRASCMQQLTRGLTQYSAKMLYGSIDATTDHECHLPLYLTHTYIAPLLHFSQEVQSTPKIGQRCKLSSCESTTMSSPSVWILRDHISDTDLSFSPQHRTLWSSDIFERWVMIRWVDIKEPYCASLQERRTPII